MAKRLRTGRYRVFYTIDEERRVVIGRGTVHRVLDRAKQRDGP